jgi:prepilin signal peptidase PulO-like enzyme (type II secretory pathway)
VYLLGIVPALILFILFLIKPDDIGAGDIKLLAVIGLVFGLQGVVLIAIIMCITVIVYSVLRRFFVQDGKVCFPLAPFMTLGVVAYITFIIRTI